MTLGPLSETWFRTLKARNCSDIRQRSVRNTDFCKFTSVARSQPSRMLGRKRGPFGITNSGVLEKAEGLNQGFVHPQALLQSRLLAID